jgi:anti-sigma factor RsiW
MHNAPHDLRDYILDELQPAQRAEVEAWLAGSPEGRGALERLRLTCSTLRSLPDEEPPQRIAFVSDKIFEPSPWARFLRWFQLEGPRFALGSAAILAVLFAGVWATEPRLSAQADGWTLAFGQQQEVVAAAPAAEPPALDEAVVQAKVQEAVATERERMRDALQTALAAMIEKRAQATEARFSGELTGTREDILSSMRILNGNYEQLIKELNQAELAAVVR